MKQRMTFNALSSMRPRRRRDDRGRYVCRQSVSGQPVLDHPRLKTGLCDKPDRTSRLAILTTSLFRRLRQESTHPGHWRSVVACSEADARGCIHQPGSTGRAMHSYWFGLGPPQANHTNIPSFVRSLASASIETRLRISRPTRPTSTASASRLPASFVVGRRHWWSELGVFPHMAWWPGCGDLRWRRLWRPAQRR